MANHIGCFVVKIFSLYYVLMTQLSDVLLYTGRWVIIV